MANEGYVSIRAWEKALSDTDKRLRKIEEKLIRNSSVSVKAWEKALSDIDLRFKEINRKLSSKGVSVSAWERALQDIYERLDRIEKKADNKVSTSAWNKANEEIIQKINSKVGIKAWEKSIEDMDREFKNLALNELKELDDRLDKTVELINNLTAHLNEKVNTAAWDRLCESNEQLIKRVDELASNQTDFLKRLSEIEGVLREAKVSEDELKKLLESIK